MKNILVSLFIITLLVPGLPGQSLRRESVLEGKESLSDDILYDIDSLPPLCDALCPEPRYVAIGDCALYCEVKGSGIPLVLINGGPGGTHHCFHPWFGVAEGFSTVVYYDQRGCGRSDRIEGPGYTFRQAVDDLDKLRQALGFDKWVVCGYSYGGALAQYYTATYPASTAGMVLIGATPLLGNAVPDGSRQQMFITERERERIRKLNDLNRKGELNDMQLLVNKALNGDWKRQNFYKPEPRRIVLSALYEWDHDPAFKQKVGWGYKQYDFTGVFTDCPIPTMLCEGEWDLTWMEQKKDIFRASHPNAHYELFPRAGHAIFSEDPETFFTALERFLTTLEPVEPADIALWKEKTTPLLEPQEELVDRENSFIRLIETEGVPAGLKYYDRFKKENPGVVLFTEINMNNLGYGFWQRYDYDSAIEVFMLNLEVYPESAIIFENLGDSYMKQGQTTKAIEYYRRSLESDPANTGLRRRLEKILESHDNQ